MIGPFPASGWSLAPVQHSVQFRRVRLVVHYSAIYFDPGVRFERHLPRTDNHLSPHAVPFQKARRGCRSLQAKRLFQYQMQAMSTAEQIFSTASEEGALLVIG